MNITINEIEKHAKAYADVREQRDAIVKEANEKIEKIKRDVLPMLRKLVAREAEKFSILFAAIDSAPELFEKPRTQIFHGIKCGFQKSKGGIDWDDDEDVVKRIHKMFPDGDAADLYLHITEKPNKETLVALPVETLKKLGCTVNGTGDAVFIKAADGAMDKVAKAMLKGAIEETEAK